MSILYLIWRLILQLHIFLALNVIENLDAIAVNASGNICANQHLLKSHCPAIFKSRRSQQQDIALSALHWKKSGTKCVRDSDAKKMSIPNYAQKIYAVFYIVSGFRTESHTLVSANPKNYLSHNAATWNLVNIHVLLMLMAE